jgi:hypothetical protein
MKKSRSQVRSVVEWVVAASVLLALAGVGLNLFGQLRKVTPVTQVIALEPEAPLPPSIVPSRAVAVPLLALAGNVSIQVGEFAADVLDRIEGLVIPHANAVERLQNGDRITHEFGHAGGRFFLVTEPSAAGTPPRVTGIFIR